MSGTVRVLLFLLSLAGLPALICSDPFPSLTLFYPLSRGVLSGEIWSIPGYSIVRLELFGTGLTNATKLTFTTSMISCDEERHSSSFIYSFSGDSALVDVNLPQFDTVVFQYFCINGVHQGLMPWKTITTYDPLAKPDELLPFSVKIVLILLLLALSGLFSGLNLGLMSLDTTELKIVSEVGSEDEQRYARAIIPIRMRGNMLLCTVLLGNVIVNSALTVLLNDVIGSGLLAVLGSSLSIVVMGEIFPQALISRHALWVGAHTVWLMKFLMILTSPVSFPVSVILDKLLGVELGSVYQRNQLLKLIQLTHENIGLAQNELNILTGALTFHEKMAGQIMTKLEDVFMLDIESVLDYRTMMQITHAGHSRIPVYRKVRSEIVGLLHVKDLCFVDADDNTPVEAIINHYKHIVEFVYDDTKLDQLLDLFRKGRTHICMVLRLDSTGPGDPTLETVGIVTLEDLLEEIIQTELEDEDMKDRSQVAPPFAGIQSMPKLSDAMTTAIVAFMATLKPFAPDIINPSVLTSYLQQKGALCEYRKDGAVRGILYSYGSDANVFTLILEGSAKVSIGSDTFSIDAGPFTTLGLEVLTGPRAVIVCDFTAVVSTESVLVMQMTRAQYQRLIFLSKQHIESPTKKSFRKWKRGAVDTQEEQDANLKKKHNGSRLKMELNPSVKFTRPQSFRTRHFSQEDSNTDHPATSSSPESVPHFEVQDDDEDTHLL